MSGTPLEEALWDLVDKWRDQATKRAGGDVDVRYLSRKPRTAHAQGLNEAAEDLADLLLAVEDEDNLRAEAYSELAASAVVVPVEEPEK